ncbi:AIC_G0027310.mRNA.1.CDS.1 [Saccharomyces cerevisiae]|nr:AIC_G0027310.mRNA.1.CDS.1 [Saccharomyces cerevisiae]CAI4410515.1 CRB_1a_G0029290.mRNA.1.CDS.1 [Saccharomyces cerevisiae]CAI5259000.1 CKB_HP2_G0025720.mRNA.1.CDS.1 [Saccharomyces cerevisiae]CAI5260129.1 AIF_HP2_G0026280.mRNA.1.CDS.1 [Saccharomyces cerevisiae]CAI6457994.1 CKB_HP2_G0025720.mRNA.1.CDS.1 [Saccharomyces cerevisiae]
MSGTRCLLGVGLPVDVTATETLTHDEQGPGVEPGPCSRGSSIDGLLPSLLGPHDDVDDDSAAFHKYMTLSRDLSKALDMSSSSSSSPRVQSRRHRSSVSAISAILHQGKSGREDITGSLSVPAEQEKLSFLAKASICPETNIRIQYVPLAAQIPRDLSSHLQPRSLCAANNNWKTLSTLELLQTFVL